MWQKKKRRKFGNVPTIIDGIRFDSAKEAKRWRELQLLVKSGEVKDLNRQVRYELCVNDIKICAYVADFVYKDNGRLVVEDVKGFKTAIYKLKKKLMKAVYEIDIFET